jgi:hypothetical protein
MKETFGWPAEGFEKGDPGDEQLEQQRKAYHAHPGYRVARPAYQNLLAHLREIRQRIDYMEAAIHQWANQ